MNARPFATLEFEAPSDEQPPRQPGECAMTLPASAPPPSRLDAPPARQVAQLNRALQQGRSSDWMMERLNGIPSRHALTEALKQAVEYVDPQGHPSSFLGKKRKEGQTPVGQFIEAETNYIYGKLGISRAARKALKNGSQRDQFDAAQLHAIGLAEQHDAKIWAMCVKDQWTREKAKQARTEMLNRLASVQQFMRELTGEAA